MLEYSNIKKILVISLTNIGDVVLTFPVIDILRSDFPQAKISVVVGPKGKSLLLENPHIHNLYIFNKQQSVPQVIRWVRDLRNDHFDLVVDLRNSAIPFFMFSRNRTSFFLKRVKGEHMLMQHLRRLKSIYPYTTTSYHHHALYIPDQDRRYVDELLRGQIAAGERFIIVGPGAADRGKRWLEEGFAVLCDRLAEKYKIKVVLIGDENDQPVIERILKIVRSPVINLCAKTTLTQLAALLEKSTLAIVNDSAPMHLASYLGVPVVAIFGPTDPKRYGPWGAHSAVVDKKIFCLACQNPRARIAHECMLDVTVNDVLNTFELTTQGVQFYRLTKEVLSRIPE